MDKWTIAFILFVLAALSGAFNLTVMLSRAVCEAQWADSGFNVRHTAFSGCRIQLKDGTWIPAANYREQ